MAWILVTGANRGLGKQLAQKLCSKGNKVIFAGRDEEALNTASENFKGQSKVFKLDLSSNESVNTAKDRLQALGINEISTLVNNGAILKTGWEQETFKEVLNVNVKGTLTLTQTLLSLIAQNGKIVNVSSGLGELSGISEYYRNLVTETENIEALYDVPFVENDAIKSGYAPHYMISKALLNQGTKLLANDQRVLERGIKVGSVCPGWCKTDMGGANAMREADQGADSILWMIENEFPSPSFYRDGKPISW